MEKHPRELLFVLVISFVCLPLPLANTSCRKISGTFCSKDDDREIMRCCLEKYKQGFDTLEKQQVDGKQPPSCRVDLDLARCLSQSQCFARVTNALRLLILNQLVFTKRVGICYRNEFNKLLEDAKNGFLLPEDVDSLTKVQEMMNMTADSCARQVYATCGGRFKHKLQKYPGFHPAQLCKVFIEEGNCIKETAVKPPPLYCAGSGILNRFKENSNKTAPSVLGALCLLPA